MSNRARFAEIRALRAAGKTRLESYQIEDQGAVYDVVDEEGYKKVVRSRLDQDDFVVDDNGEGYADDGREEWQTERKTCSSGDDELPVNAKAAKRKRGGEKEQNEKMNHKILSYFNNGSVTTVPKAKVGLSS